MSRVTLDIDPLILNGTVITTQAGTRVASLASSLLNGFGEELVHRYNAYPELVQALEKVDTYFHACVNAWAVDDGVIINADGKPIVEAEGLDHLCDLAGSAVKAALAQAKGQP